MQWKDLLGKYNKQEKLYLNAIGSKAFAGYSTESRGGKMNMGKRMDVRYNFLPTEEENRQYIENSLRSIEGNGE